MSGFDWYKRTVNSIMPGFSQGRGQEQRFAPGGARPMSPTPNNSPFSTMVYDPMGNTGFPALEPDPETQPQQMTGFRSEAASGDPSYMTKPNYRQAEIASMEAYRKMQNAGSMGNPVKAQAPANAGQTGFYYLDDGQGNVRPYGYASSPPMIPGYNAVRDPNGKQTFGGMPQPMAQAPTQPQPTLRLEGEPDPNAGFFARLFGGR